MSFVSPDEYYAARVNELSAQKKQLLRRRSLLGWSRLAAILIAGCGGWYAGLSSLTAGIIIFILFAAVFVYLFRLDLENQEAIDHNARLMQINADELLVLEHRFIHLPDGLEFKKPEHPYANDLDIFGRASLYQYLNRSESQQGNTLLAQWLSGPAPSNEILQRQEAIKEIAAKVEWRQEFQSIGKAKPVHHATQQKIREWLERPERFLQKQHWSILRFLLPVISLGILGSYLGGFLAWDRFTPLIVLMMIIASMISGRITKDYNLLGKIAPQLITISSSIERIESASFNAQYLKFWQDNLLSGERKTSTRIRGLSRILERMDYRLNFVVSIPLNTFFFWDLQQVFALEKWKRENKTEIDHWFETIAVFEATSSLGNLCFNQPSWVFPTITAAPSVFSATALGHPLIHPARRVASDFSTEGKGQVALVTGSNMAGKSTFLRSIGVNMVLALAGAPVCARKLTVTPMRILSSMRISDNLEESTSTFYAELKKLKIVIDAANAHESVFILLDEILRGTNSADRHTGSAALIEQLIREEASGVLATHDLELATLQEKYPGNIHNYHFDVQVENDELYFDYLLKEGVCKSMNASILMKKIGIRI